MQLLVVNEPKNKSRSLLEEDSDLFWRQLPNLFQEISEAPNIQLHGPSKLSIAAGKSLIIMPNQIVSRLFSHQVLVRHNYIIVESDLLMELVSTWFQHRKDVKLTSADLSVGRIKALDVHQGFIKDIMEIYLRACHVNRERINRPQVKQAVFRAPLMNSAPSDLKVM